MPLSAVDGCTYIDTSVKYTRKYRYAVSPVDGEGREGQRTEPVSVTIPGQVGTSSGTVVRNLDGRVRSFTAEVASGAGGDFVWPTIRPGSCALSPRSRARSPASTN